MARRVGEEGYLPKHRPTALLIEEMMEAQRREWRMRVGLVFGSVAAVLLILALAVLAHLAD